MAATPVVTFFEERLPQSEIKSLIVAKYLTSWGKIMATRHGRETSKIAYIDLFAGPGRYRDGNDSTPLLIIKRALLVPELRQNLVTVFNDANPDSCAALEQSIRALPGFDTLAYQPIVVNRTVDDEVAASFQRIRMIPSLVFLDPWGYKGVSLDLIDSTIKDWGCECVFFFNYRRLNPAIDNPVFANHVDAFFGADTAQQLRRIGDRLGPRRREELILDALKAALRRTYGQYVMAFCFKAAGGVRTNHYLVHVTKNVLGYVIMKQIMAELSSYKVDGVPSFEFVPGRQIQPILEAPLQKLIDELRLRFAGRSASVRQVYEQHNIDTPYILPNYKDALRALESQDLIDIDPPVGKRPTRGGVVTLKDQAVVTFPRR